MLSITQFWKLNSVANLQAPYLKFRENKRNNIQSDIFITISLESHIITTVVGD